MTESRIWNQPFPYTLVANQAPADGQAHPETHVAYPEDQARGHQDVGQDDESELT